MKRGPEHEHRPPEPWVTKRQLADHLSVTPRWIELQQLLGLPHLSTGGMNRYRISEVEAWLRERYGSPQRHPSHAAAERGPLGRRWFRTDSPSFASSRLDRRFCPVTAPETTFLGSRDTSRDKYRGAEIRTRDLTDPNEAQRTRHANPLQIGSFIGAAGHLRRVDIGTNQGGLGTQTSCMPKHWPQSVRPSLSPPVVRAG